MGTPRQGPLPCGSQITIANLVGLVITFSVIFGRFVYTSAMEVGLVQILFPGSFCVFFFFFFWGGGGGKEIYNAH